MRIAITAIVAAALAIFTASMLGVASAEAPAPTTTTVATPVPVSPPVRTVSVQGIATAPIAQGSSVSSATADYRQAMAAAVSDGQNKAEFLAGKVGATLGIVQSVTEDGGSIECRGEESRYTEYEGEQPDFGSLGSTVLPERAAAAVPPAAPASHKVTAKHRKARHPSAKTADASTCTLSAQVSLVYALD
jgi:hypothetical protein